MFWKTLVAQTSLYTFVYSFVFIGLLSLAPATEAAVNAQVTMASIDDWGSEFQGQARIRNMGQNDINGWTLSFDTSFEIQQLWGARIVSHNGSNYVVESVDYNNVITPNGEANFGFIASPGGSSMPIKFTVNGDNTNSGTDPDPTPTPAPTPLVSCATADENENMLLTCPAGQVIKTIDFASYGTPDGLCGSFTTGSCNASNSVSVVSDACNGKNSCMLIANNNTFGDPCYGTVKKLATQVSCGTAVDPTPVPTPVPSNNHQPSARISPPQNPTSGQTVTLDGSASSDPDGDVLSYLWTQTQGANIDLTDHSNSSLTFIAPTVTQPTQYTFTLTVNDGELNNEATVMVLVSPVSSAGLCDTASEGNSLTLNCPSGQVITEVNFASYGTPGGSCGSFTTGSCNASNSLSVVSDACEGKNSCTVYAGNDNFGDPCYGTVKKLAAQVVCGVATHPTPTPSPPPDNNTGVTSLKSLVPFPIGVAVNAGNEANSIISSGTSARQQAVVLPHFNQMTAGNIMKMSYLHPSENSFTFDQADALVSFATAQGIAVHGHTLIWHSDYQVPSFMKNYSGDFAAMLKKHVQTITTHYAGKVDSWDVVNEALADNGESGAVNGFRNSVFYQKMGVNFIDQAFINARAADPNADLFYNDYSIENGDAKTNNMLSLVDGLKARNIPITGVGFQMHLLSDWPATSTIEAAMKAVADRGLKVKISELDVRVNNPYNPSAPVYTSLTAEAANKQKERYRQIVAAYLRAVPPSQRAGITVWGVWDADSWLNTSQNPDWPLLFDDNFNAKPALQGFADGLTGH